jgi:subtilisin family serine protease
MLFVVALLLSSLSIPLAAGIPANGLTPTEASQTTPDLDQLNLQAPDWSSHHWDWRALQDDSGFVHVIIWTDSVSAFQTKVSRAESSLGYDMSNDIEIDGGTSSLFAIHERFSSTIQGFSAKIKLDLFQELLASDPSIQAYPDLPVNATVLDNIQQIGADQVWSRVDTGGHSVTGYGVSVAVIDTGVDYMHPDLGGGFGPGYKVVGGYDFYNGDADPMDDNGHGTHVAGIIAANGVIKGVAPNATLYAYKILGADGTGSMSMIVSAIDAALDPNGDGSTADHVDVISMSLGGQGSSDDPACMAVQKAVAAGVVVVVAAGNEGPAMRTVGSPGLSSYAITVGAVDSSGNLASFSSRGPTEDMLMKPEVSAPGVSIYSTVPTSAAGHSSPTGYMNMSGTSMATPHVSGSAALLIQLHRSWTPAQVKSALVTYANQIDESLWSAGSGEIWVPSSADADLFSSVPLLAYGMGDSGSKSLTITNLGSGITLSTSSSDRFGLAADGQRPAAQWTNVSSSSPSSITLGSGGQGSVTVSVDASSDALPEGYYDGWMQLTSSSRSLRVPFGFMILSQVTVHVLDVSGAEVFDPYGGVWVYDIPDADVAFGIRGDSLPAPPATFMLPSGTYSVHALGHQLIYSYSDPYILSNEFTIGRFNTADIYIGMATAHKLQLNLSTGDGEPIYVKDYRTYVRHVGARNVSFDVTATDYTVTGSEIFALPKSLSIYVSNTLETVGISIAGLSYSPAMWSFMELNWQHWYEYTSGTSTRFMMEASADLEYLLSWEYNGITTSTPSVLPWDESSSRTYVTKFDIPGTLTDPWCNWGNHRASGGDAVFWIRRDTDTSLNPFYSGMTRTIFVKGVFTDIYYPGNVLDGFAETEMYAPDYDYLVRAATISEIYLPNRNFLSPLPATTVNNRVGMGPFFSAVRTENTNDSMVLFQPLLRDQSGAKIGMMSTPTMYLYKDGLMVGITLLADFVARPDAVRFIDLYGPSKYTVSIDTPLSSQVSNDVLTELGFYIPAEDRDPPRILGLDMSQRFVPGQQIPVHLTAYDSDPTFTAEISWRKAGDTSWIPLTLAAVSPGNFTSAIQTSAGDDAIDLFVRLTDSTGNFIQSTIHDASLKQVPIRFDLNPSTDILEYKDRGVLIGMSGYLTDTSGQPLNALGGVPIELIANGKKVAMLLDEHMLSGSHSHDGTITFDWYVNPTFLFTGPDQTVDVTATIDLGIYQPMTVTFSLHSIASMDVAPEISLVSPANNSLIAPGRTIDLSITDDGTFTAVYSVDGGTSNAFGSPWDISTTSWTDGSHTLKVSATDDDLLTAIASFTFTVDAVAPQLTILSPTDGSQVPIGSTLVISASDAHLAQVVYSLDGGPSHIIAPPYQVDMSSWSLGTHNVSATATDAVDHQTTATTTFEIVNSTVVVSLLSPANGSVIHSGVAIVLSVSGAGTISCEWSEQGVSRTVTSPYQISTTGWSEGTHNILVSAFDNLGGSSELPITMVIDDTPPVMSLVSPAYGSFVTPEDEITFTVDDSHFESVSWTIWGVFQQSTSRGNIVSLSGFTNEGYFTLDVTAVDMAGNSKNELFSFAMDISRPSVSIIGVASGGAIAPGALLSISASDEFLSTVAWGLDSSATNVITDPYQIDTSGFSSGRHTLNATANDYSGKISNASLRLYVDRSPPSIVIDFPDHFHENSTLVVVAHITDDYAVSNASVVYELQGGGTSSVPMNWTGSFYQATIPYAQLWDGMGVHIHARDTVGNSADSPTLAISAAPGPPDGDDGDGGGTVSFITSWIGLISIAAAVAAIAILIILFYSRRSDQDEEYESERPARPAPRPQLRGPSMPAQAYSTVGRASQPLARAPPTAPAVKPVSLRFELARPVVTSGTPAPRAAQESPPTEEEDFIAKELTELQQQVSLLRQDVVKAMMKAGTKGQQDPRRLSGLNLKKLMDSEEEK